MSVTCTILLVIAAGVIGWLLPRKKQKPETVIAYVNQPVAPQEYGLFLPPDCESVTFSKLKEFSTFHHEYERGETYTSVTLQNPGKIKIAFRRKHTISFEPDVKGVVK